MRKYFISFCIIMFFWTSSVKAQSLCGYITDIGVLETESGAMKVAFDLNSQGSDEKHHFNFKIPESGNYHIFQNYFNILVSAYTEHTEIEISYEENSDGILVFKAVEEDC